MVGVAESGFRFFPGGIGQSRAKCPSCPHLKHTVSGVACGPELELALGACDGRTAPLRYGRPELLPLPFAFLAPSGAFALTSSFTFPLGLAHGAFTGILP